MVYGYVIISVKNSYKHNVSDKISRINGVVDVEPLVIEESAMIDPFFEDYDLITKVKVDNADDLLKIVKNKINPIQGIIKTKIVSKNKN